MNPITVRAASYWRYAPPCFGPGAALDTAIDAFADGLAAQIAHTCPAAWHTPERYLCSTIVSSMLTDRQLPQALRFKRRLAQATGAPAPLLINAYECASWGYTLRHSAGQPGPRQVLLVIADLDVHQFDHWTQAELWRNLWGHTGFGVTVLAIELAGGAGENLRLTPSAGPGSLMEFARQVKSLCAASPEALLCQPFFPEKTQEMFARLVGCANPLPQLHAQYGHCFGSDPWIALITERLAQGTAPRERQAVVASLAFNGYSATARVCLAADAFVDLQDRPALAATPATSLPHPSIPGVDAPTCTHV